MNPLRLKQLPQSFLDRIFKNENGCWIWTGARLKSGYGHYSFKNKTYLSHRFSYLVSKGKIPPCFDVDHLCKVTSCCNPEHLEAVTRLENLLRGNTIIAHYAAQNKCKRGHVYSVLTIAKRKGFRKHHRLCKICDYLRKKIAYKKRVEADPNFRLLRNAKNREWYKINNNNNKTSSL